MDICGTREIKDRVRNVQENTVAGVDLTESVDKMRYLITLFTQISAPNDILDGENRSRKNGQPTIQQHWKYQYVQ